MPYAPYPQYKPADASGVAHVPSHWSVKRLRYAARLNPARRGVELPPETVVSFVPMEAVGEGGGLALHAERTVNEIGAGYTFFADDDVVVAKITPCFENRKGALATGLKSGVAFGTTELHVIRSGGELDPEFLFYVTIADHFRSIGESEMYGAGGQKRVPETFIKDFRIAIPPLDEQRKIAAALRRQTEVIDSLIEKRRRLLSLLEEKRFAIITHIVTSGLDSSAPTRESGVDWIGRVPSHWDVARIKQVAKLESGHTPSRSVPEYWIDCDIPWVSLNDTQRIAESDYIFETTYQINSLGLANSSARLLPPGSVVFTRDATIGLAAITGREMAVSQHLIAWVPSDKIEASYLLRVFDAMRTYLDKFTFGATIKTIGMDDVRGLYTPLPPKAEQIRIVEEIGKRVSALAALRDNINQAIERLIEYRATLITDAVTGKIDLRQKSPKQVAA